MGTVFEELAEKRANERAEETRIKTLFDSIKNLMEIMGWTAEQAMEAMKISETDEELLIPKL